MKVYYNEFDKFAAQWLRNLGEAGEINKGGVDERSIADVQPQDLTGYDRVHFFAGIGGWELALRLAGWPDEVPVWTGSCPCQPFSSAGKGHGEKDPRHLWPDMFRLISECRPEFIFGEQVASAIRHGWLDGVQADLEGIGYTCGSAVIGAHSVGAPHIRQRLYWCARRMAQDPAGERRGRRDDGDTARNAGGIQAAGLGADGGMGDGKGDGHSWGQSTRERGAGAAYTGAINPWSDYRIIPCTDGKARRTGPRVFPLANGLPRSMAALGPELEKLAEVEGLSKGSIREASRSRVGMLKGSGNSIVPELAAEFIAAFMDTVGMERA